MHRVPGTLAGRVMQARWHGGAYLGKRQESNESYVSVSGGGVVKARDFREVAESSAWDPEVLKEICGTPYHPPSALPPQVHGDDEE